MGDIRQLKKKYSGPRHPWEKDRIEEEKVILLDYGLKNKTEIWKMNSLLKSFTNQAKKLIAGKGMQAEKEKQQLFKKLERLGLLKSGVQHQLDDVLTLKLNDVLDRRLQTLIYRKNLAKTMRQARQFIIHQHVRINNKLISAPSYLVSIEEESNIQFAPKSGLSNPDHPSRIEKVPSKEKIEIKEEAKEDDKK